MKPSRSKTLDTRSSNSWSVDPRTVLLSAKSSSLVSPSACSAVELVGEVKAHEADILVGIFQHQLLQPEEPLPGDEGAELDREARFHLAFSRSLQRHAFGVRLDALGVGAPFGRIGRIGRR